MSVMNTQFEAAYAAHEALIAAAKKKITQKETPQKEGWYWIKYRGKRGLVVCPCIVTHVGPATIVTTARNDSFIEGPNHGGMGLRYGGKLDKSIRFGPEITL